jgi:hypothetical protein
MALQRIEQYLKCPAWRLRPRLEAVDGQAVRGEQHAHDADTRGVLPTDAVISALAAIGISEPDPAFKGPYFQWHNANGHGEAAQRLYGAGKAYYCDCTREQVKERTGSEHLGYDGFCRERELVYEEGRALRFRTPDEGTIVVVDQEFGKQTTGVVDLEVGHGEGPEVQDGCLRQASEDLIAV